MRQVFGFVSVEVKIVRLSWIMTLIACLSCVIVGQSSDENFQSDLGQDVVFPTPLIRLMMNDTVAASLRLQTENVSNSVSNTSLNDLYNDNNTQQMQIRYRERKRQQRIRLIQRDILQKLGFSREPNVTSRLSNEERLRMIQMFDRTFEVQSREPTTTIDTTTTYSIRGNSQDNSSYYPPNYS